MKHKIPCPQELQQHSMDIRTYPQVSDIRYKTCRLSAVYQVQTQHQTYEDQVGDPPRVPRHSILPHGIKAIQFLVKLKMVLQQLLAIDILNI